MVAAAQVLNTQYRMHPAITAFPSREFYAGLLHDAPGMAESMTAPWHEHAGLGPLAFYDVRGALCFAVTLMPSIQSIQICHQVQNSGMSRFMFFMRNAFAIRHALMMSCPHCCSCSPGRPKAAIRSGRPVSIRSQCAVPMRAGKEQMPAGSSSLVNKVEAEMLLCVFQQFMRKLPELTQRPATAIITPYKAHVCAWADMHVARPLLGPTTSITASATSALKHLWSRLC